MQVQVKTNILEFQETLDQIGRDQLPYAAASTLTHLAQIIHGNERTVMQRVFDRPTDWTLNSLYVKPAEKKDWPKPEARTFFKQWAGGKGTTPDDYLMAEVTGGPRKRKRMEKALIARGIMDKSEYAVPAKGSSLDAFGNLPRGVVMKILSDLQASETFGGHTSNRSRSKRSLAKQKKSSYFFADVDGIRGIWQRQRLSETAAGIRPILIFVGIAKYRKRFAFFEIAENTVKAHYDRLFTIHFNDALATARTPKPPA